ncbi:MBL fold metallo-hydrolase [Streptomyces sp. KL116D]|uniref:MBL fold metallo-hydrolase n=1 Tax=Streptomyces sp. KL116D TaxID=3045152 RepID=UPI003555D851
MGRARAAFRRDPSRPGRQAPRPIPLQGPLDRPRSPVPVHTPGHTRGHCAYHPPTAGILVTGDALVTAHPRPASRVRSSCRPCSTAAGPRLWSPWT